MDDRFGSEVEYEIANPRQGILAALPLLGLRPGCGCTTPGARGGPPGPVRAGARPGWASRRARQRDRSPRTRRRALVGGDRGAADRAVGGRSRRPSARDSIFDVAWAAATLRELRRVVRPGWLVAILDADLARTFPILPWPPELEGRLRAAALAVYAADCDGKLPYHFAAYLGRALPRLLREVGLVAVRIAPRSAIDRAPLDPRRAM